MGNLLAEFKAADASPGFLLWRVTNRWQAAQRQALEPFDLTHVQFVILASLVWLESNEPISQKQLADHAQTNVMMTSQVLRALETKKLIVREINQKDKRVIFMRPTAKGNRLVNKAIVVVEQVDYQFFAKLGTSSSDFITCLQHLVL